MKTRLTRQQVICAEVLKTSPHTPAELATATNRLRGDTVRTLRCMEEHGHVAALAGDTATYVLTSKGERELFASHAAHALMQKDEELPLFAEPEIDEPVIENKPDVFNITAVSFRKLSKISVGTALILRDGDNQIALTAEDARDLYKKLQPYVGFAGSLMGDVA